MLIVIGTVTVDPEALAGLAGPLADMVAASRAEAGCLHYSLTIEDADAGVIAVAERWRDEAALKAHMQEPHAAALQAALAGRIRGMNAKLYDASNERRLPI